MTVGELIKYLETFPKDMLLVKFDHGTTRPNLRWEPMEYPQQISVYRPDFSPRYFREWKEGRDEIDIEALEF